MDFRLTWILAAPWALLLAAPAAWAENPTGAMFPTTSYLDRLEQAEAESEVLGTQADCGCAEDCGDLCGGGCGVAPCGVAAGGYAAGGLYAGYASVIVKPHVTQNAAYEKVTYEYDQQTWRYTYEKKPFGFDYEYTPRIWLGYVDPGGFGVRCRYWQFDQKGDPFSLEDDEAYDQDGSSGFYYWAKARIPCNEKEWKFFQGDITYGLELHAADFEVTQDLDFGRTWAVASGGVRYARVVQDYQAATTLASSYSITTVDLQTGHIFDGLGPTLALELHRPIGGGGFALFATARGSVLFGDADAYIRESDSTVIVEDSQETDEERSYRGDDVIGVCEGQIGVEWTRAVGPGYLVVRGGYEGQLWDGLGAPNNSDCMAPLGFEGFIIDVGLTR